MSSISHLFRPVESLLRLFHRLDEPNLVRDRPMKMLALGLSRCGTDSLERALEELGYNGVYQGFEVEGDQCMVWTQQWDAKVAGSKKKIGAEDLDRVIGNYKAIIDMIGCMFTEEFIDAYPHAKVCLSFDPPYLQHHQSLMKCWN